MKKLLVWAIFLALAVVAPFTAGAQVGVSVNMGIPCRRPSSCRPLLQ